jgi:hypothetical protein
MKVLDASNVVNVGGTLAGESGQRKAAGEGRGTMIAMRGRPLGLLGWLVWTVLEWVAGDGAAEPARRPARARASGTA